MLVQDCISFIAKPYEKYPIYVYQAVNNPANGQKHIS